MSQSFAKMFDARSVVLGLEAGDKNQVLTRLVDALVAGKQLDAARRDAVLDALLERESLGSTGIGGGIAIPHVKTDQVTHTVTAVAVSRTAVEYKAVDGEPCDLFFLLVSPKSQSDEHLQMLRWMSKLVRNQDFCRFVRRAGDADEVVALIQEMGG